MHTMRLDPKHFIHDWRVGQRSGYDIAISFRHFPFGEHCGRAKERERDGFVVCIEFAFAHPHYRFSTRLMLCLILNQQTILYCDLFWTAFIHLNRIWWWYSELKWQVKIFNLQNTDFISTNKVVVNEWMLSMISFLPMEAEKLDFFHAVDWEQFTWNRHIWFILWISQKERKKQSKRDTKRER